MNEKGPARAEALSLWGPKRSSLVLSLDKHSAGKYSWEPGINIELLTELLFPVEKPLWEFRWIFSSSTSSPSYNQHFITKLQCDRLSLQYLSGQWSMDYGFFRAVDNLNYLAQEEFLHLLVALSQKGACRVNKT